MTFEGISDAQKKPLKMTLKRKGLKQDDFKTDSRRMDMASRWVNSGYTDQGVTKHLGLTVPFQAAPGCGNDSQLTSSQEKPGTPGRRHVPKCFPSDPPKRPQPFHSAPTQGSQAPPGTVPKGVQARRHLSKH